MTDIPKSLAQLRQDRGMSIEALAVAIKVSPAKLQALEAGRYDELANAAYARALAMAVCRALKADPRHILASLPSPDHHSILTEVPEQQPFKSGRARLNLDTSFLRDVKQVMRPKFLVPLLILVAAAAVNYWPDGPLVSSEEVGAPQPQAQLPVAVAEPPSAPAPDADNYSFDQAALAAASAVAAESAPSEPSPPSEPVASAPLMSAVVLAPLAVVPPTLASSPMSSAVPAPAVAGSRGSLVLLASAESWVQIKDANGEQLLKRLVLPGERIALQGALPMKIKLGNAVAVQLTYQGKPLDLTEHTRANVARFELN